MVASGGSPNPLQYATDNIYSYKVTSVFQFLSDTQTEGENSTLFHCFAGRQDNNCGMLIKLIIIALLFVINAFVVVCNLF